ncbi:citrate-binding protein [Cajanus cajan]|uniref:Citrate-binding protein n=1 Tax=Cajanus cajan TaxID=3821 RepID=A0A151TQU5_CAJCA|nr:citrate-binding protein [Cajanus cajan]KYP69390.1 Citrate-binding protein [Cajanus cajan]
MGTLYQITLVNIVLYVSLFMNRTNTLPVDLTLGFTELPLNTSNFDHHKPYDVPVTQRYSFIDGVHKLWVYSTDKPLSQNSTTRPRSEIRIRGYDYSSGVWQFQGQGFVPYGTSGVCIMQVFGADYPRATTLMVRTYNNTLSYYKAPILVPNIWGRWFQLNVIHDVEASNVKVYLDGVQVYEATGYGGFSHYFKFGVYTQNDPSNYMESRWRGVRVLKKVYH